MDTVSNNKRTGTPARFGLFRAIYAVVALAILSVPLVAMQFSNDEVEWTLGDFAVAGAMLLVLGIAIELVLRFVSDRWLRVTAIGLGLALFVFVWGGLATG